MRTKSFYIPESSCDFEAVKCMYLNENKGAAAIAHALGCDMKPVMDYVSYLRACENSKGILDSEIKKLIVQKGASSEEIANSVGAQTGDIRTRIYWMLKNNEILPASKMRKLLEVFNFEDIFETLCAGRSSVNSQTAEINNADKGKAHWTHVDNAEMLKLRLLEGRTLVEIGKRFGMSSGSVRYRLSTLYANKNDLPKMIECFHNGDYDIAEAAVVGKYLSRIANSTEIKSNEPNTGNTGNGETNTPCRKARTNRSSKLSGVSNAELLRERLIEKRTLRDIANKYGVTHPYIIRKLALLGVGDNEAMAHRLSNGGYSSEEAEIIEQFLDNGGVIDIRKTTKKDLIDVNKFLWSYLVDCESYSRISGRLGIDYNDTVLKLTQLEVLEGKRRYSLSEVAEKLERGEFSEENERIISEFLELVHEGNNPYSSDESELGEDSESEGNESLDTVNNPCDLGESLNKSDSFDSVVRVDTETIRKLRIKNKFTRKALSNVVGIEVDRYDRIEDNLITPDLNEVYRIGSLFGINWKDLLLVESCNEE